MPPAGWRSAAGCGVVRARCWAGPARVGLGLRAAGGRRVGDSAYRSEHRTLNIQPGFAKGLHRGKHRTAKFCRPGLPPEENKPTRRTRKPPQHVRRQPARAAAWTRGTVWTEGADWQSEEPAFPAVHEAPFLRRTELAHGAVSKVWKGAVRLFPRVGKVGVGASNAAWKRGGVGCR